MAWNPKPEIAALRDMANKFNFDQVVALGFKYQAGQIEAMSYGRTRKLCDLGAELAKVCMEAVQNIDTPKPVAGVTWVDASTSVPADELTVLLVLECGEVWTGFRDGDDWRYVSADLVTEPVTYWAEFPAPPVAAAPVAAVCDRREGADGAHRDAATAKAGVPDQNKSKTPLPYAGP